ncbi:hypothetical protein [Polymorphospora rubra]|uniref:hypothetical protein n=1 Tax=Polymorphospora rubra TaxID=338584 RepID=UPI0033F6FD47
MSEDWNEVFGWLVIIGVVLLVAKLVFGDSEAKPADSEAKPSVTGPRWEGRVKAARHVLKYCLTRAEEGEKHYQEAETRLATGRGATAHMQIEKACIYGHWRALLHLSVIRAIERKPDEAMKALDKAVVTANPAGIEPDDFRPKMVGMALVWLEVRPWSAKSWEESVGRKHPGLTGSQLRAKTVEAIIETIPPLKP